MEKDLMEKLLLGQSHLPNSQSHLPNLSFQTRQPTLVQTAMLLQKSISFMHLVHLFLCTFFCIFFWNFHLFLWSNVDYTSQADLFFVIYFLKKKTRHRPYKIYFPFCDLCWMIDSHLFCLARLILICRSNVALKSPNTPNVPQFCLQVQTK